ncbi:MAG TPA: YdeI/OmpD-associated family protein [Flavobacterium sp.]|nr:YdeI/OmpD-associated family protein [Flavobacterium sp.]
MTKANPWSEAFEKIKEILSKTPLKITVKWGANVYVHNGKNIVSVGAFKNHIALVFFNGVFIDDAFNVFSSDTTAKAMRQWKFKYLEEIDEKKILNYVNQAIKNSEEGKELKAEKHQPVPTAELLLETFKKDKKLKEAFERLTSGKQKEYSLYINEAKQETTKLKRIEKIIPMILQGVGLHDKYKNC